jgi:hypothetical protein
MKLSNRLCGVKEALNKSPRTLFPGLFRHPLAMMEQQNRPYYVTEASAAFPADFQCYNATLRLV